MTGWNGYFAPAGTPKPITDKLSKAMQTICRDPEVVQKMANLSLQAVGSTPEELAAAIAQDLPVYRQAAEAWHCAKIVLRRRDNATLTRGEFTAA